METLGRDRRIWWVVDVVQGGGRAPKGGGEKSWPGAEQTEGHGRRFFFFFAALGLRCCPGAFL